MSGAPDPLASYVPPPMVADGLPPEAPEEEAFQTYSSQLPPTSGQAFGAEYKEQFGPGVIQRQYERGAAPDASPFQQFLRDPLSLSPAPADAPRLSPEEINRRFAPEGTQITDHPMTEQMGQIVGKQAAEKLQRENILNRFSNTYSWGARTATSVATFMLDPLSSAAALTPGIGEEAILARFGYEAGTAGLAARVAARAASGFTGGLAAQAPISAGRYALADPNGDDYSLRQGFLDMMFAGSLNSIIHSGIGGLREAGIINPDEIMARVPESRPIVEAPPQARYDATKTALGQVVDGKPVDVAPVVEPHGQPLTPADLAEQQRRLEAEGYAQGMRQDEFRKANDEIYGNGQPKPKEEPGEGLADFLDATKPLKEQSPQVLKALEGLPRRSDTNSEAGVPENAFPTDAYDLTDPAVIAKLEAAGIQGITQYYHSGTGPAQRSTTPFQAAGDYRFPPKRVGEDDQEYAYRVVDQAPLPTKAQLPEDAEAYFRATPDTTTIPLSRILLTKEGREPTNAMKFLAAARAGAIDRRAPIDVFQQSDGSYAVVDGNGTVAAARQAGWKEIPARLVEARRPAATEEEIKSVGRRFIHSQSGWGADKVFASAAINQPALDAMGREITAEIGPDAEWVQAPPKSRARFDQKLAERGTTDAGRITDVVRGTIALDKPEAADAAVEMLAKRADILDEDWRRYPGGYVDRKVNIRFPDGQVGEIILISKRMQAVKDTAHLLLNEARGKTDGEHEATMARVKVEMYDHYYGPAIQVDDGPWEATYAARASEVGRGGSLPKVFENRASETIAPPLNTEAAASPSALDQAPSSSLNTNNLRPPSDSTIAAGTPSQSSQVTSAIAHNPIREAVAVTPTGRRIPVQYAIADLDSLVASHTPNLDVNPAYPQELQPRDRTRAQSEAQISGIATHLNPELMGEQPQAGDGAPIVDKGGVIESGNGRILALRRVAESMPEKWQEYQKFLTDHGYNTEGIAKPVLVRIRTGELPGAERAAFTREANAPTVSAMSAGEQAVSDARAIPDDILALHQGGDFRNVGNGKFVTAAINAIAPSQGERAALMTADGALSDEGARRIERALLARAFGDDPHLIAALTEASEDSGIKAIVGALTDVAPRWSRMRAEADAGRIDPSVDSTSNLLEAIAKIREARRAGKNLSDLVNQNDIFAGQLDPKTVTWIRSMFRDQGLTKPLGRDKVAELLDFYQAEARKQTAGPNLLGEASATPEQILAAKRASDQRLGRQLDLLGAKPGGGESNVGPTQEARPTVPEAGPGKTGQAVGEKPPIAQPAKTPEEAQLAELERQWAKVAPAARLTPEEQAELAQTAAALSGKRYSLGEDIDFLEYQEEKLVDRIKEGWATREGGAPVDDISALEKELAGVRVELAGLRKKFGERMQAAGLGTKYTPLTPQERVQTDAGHQALVTLLKRLSPGAKLEIFADISHRGRTIYGEMDPTKRLISYSMESPDAEQTIRHEVIHDLRAAGAFSDSEWQSIVDLARDKGALTRYKIRDRYYDLNDAKQEEEAIAELYSKGRADLFAKYPEPIRQIFLKVHDFFQALGESMRKIFGAKATAADILRQIERGERGAKVADVAPVGGEKMSETAPAAPEAEPSREAAVRNRTDALRNALVRNNILTAANAAHATGGLKAATAHLRSLLVWDSKSPILHNVESQWHALTKQWQSVVGNKVRQAGLERAAASGQLDYEIADEMWRLSDKDSVVGAAPDPRASPGKYLGQAFRPALDLARQRLNAAGAHIGSAIDYVTHTSWDSRALRRAGGTNATREESYQAWKAKDYPRMADKTFEHLETRLKSDGTMETRDQAKERFLRSVYDATSTGVHLQGPQLSGMADDGNGYIPPAYLGTHNIARGVSQQRVIYWKDARSWVDHMKEFGGGHSIYAQVMASLDQGARKVALMEKLGTNPEANFNSVAQTLIEQHRTDDDLARFRADIEGGAGLKTILSYLDGSANMPINEDWARRLNYVQTWQATSKLGGVSITHLAAAPGTVSAEMAHHGVSHLNSIGNVLRAVLSGRGPLERQEILAEAGAYSQGYNLLIHATAKPHDLPGYASWLSSNFMRLTGLEYFLGRLQGDAVKSVLMTKLGRQVHLPFDQIDPLQANLLSKYGITSREWDLLRNSPENLTIDGLRYLTPHAATTLDTAAVEQILRDRGTLTETATPDRIANEVQKFTWHLGDSYLQYLNDAAEHSTVTAGARERALMIRGAKPGSVAWMLARSFALFKMWPVAAWNQIVMREIGYSLTRQQMLKNFAWIGALSVGGGALRMSVNDVVNGRPQRDYSHPGTLMAALAQGGGLGIFGDFMFGESARTGADITSTFGGPIFSDLQTFWKIYGRFKQEAADGDPKAFDHTWPELASWARYHVPFSNLIFAKTATDYLLWYSVQEAAHPGWWERTNRRLLKEQGRAMVGYTPGAGVPFGYPGVYLKTPHGKATGILAPSRQ